MSIVVTNLTVLGTAAPWKFGGSASSGPASSLVAYGNGFNDGSNAAGGTAGQNSAYRYGQQHVSPGGETGPTTLAVTPLHTLFLQYLSGTVATQGGGAGNSPPTGSPTTTLTPTGVGETDSSGYTMPTNVITGFRGININGTVNTSGTAVTWVSGNKFDTGMAGLPIWINNTQFTVSIVTSPTTLTLTATAGTLTGVGYFFYSARTNVGGLVGAFTDASGIIISTFDWASWGGTSAANSYVAFVVPPGAAFLSLGINDTILRDNTGSFSMTAYDLDCEVYVGDATSPNRYPVGIQSAGMGGDQYKSTVYMQPSFVPLYDTSPLGLLSGYAGQLWPHGAQNTGGVPPGTAGQNFPY